MKQLQLSKLSKSLQRNLYTFSTSTYGACVLVVFAFITLNSLLHVIQSFVGIGIVNRATFFGDECSETCDKMFLDNVGHVNAKNKLCFTQPMDIVYTWVNGSDPLHAKDLAFYTALENEKTAMTGNATLQQAGNATHTANTTSTEKQEDNSISGSNRFRDNEELRYSLRSIEKYAPWIRKVFIVTNGQVPYWLNTKNPRVKIISHKDIFLNQSHLPTFSSPAIESHIHRIPGLSDYFIYLNDDVMFGNNIYPTDFLSLQPNAGGQKVFLSWDVPDCAPGCGANWIGDGYCDTACNCSACDWDGGDCKGTKPRGTYTWGSSSSGYNYNSNNSPWMQEQALRQIKLCSKSCFDHWIGDKFCDNPCNVPECGFDAGDCGFTRIVAELPSVVVKKKTSKFYLKGDLKSVYCDLTNVIPASATIRSGSHNNHDWIRSSTLSQKQKMMTITFFKTQAELAALNATLTNPPASNATASQQEPKITPFEADKNVTVVIEADNIVLNKETGMNTTETIKITIFLIGKDHRSLLFKTANASVILDPKYATEDVPEQAKPQEEKEVEKVIEKEADTKELAKPAEIEQKIDELEKKRDEAVKKLDDLLAKQIKHKKKEQPVHDETENKVLPHKVRKQHQKEADQDEEPVVDQKDVVQPKVEAKKQKHKRAHKPKDEDDAQEIGLEHLQHRRKLLSIEDEERPRFRIRVQRDEDHGEIIQNTIRSDYLERLNRLENQVRVQQDVAKEIEKEMEEKETAESNVVRSSPGRRKLMDKFGDSLVHVNKLLNQRYGRVSRKVPAHMPHMIQKKLMEELQDIWAPHFDKTSSNRFRSSDDMQYAFSYYYYLMHEGKNYSAIEFFGNLDSDKNGYLDSNEVRLLTRLMDKKWKIPFKKVSDLQSNMTLLVEPKQKTENTPPAPAVNNNTTSTNNTTLGSWWSTFKSSDSDQFDAFNNYLKAVNTLLNVTMKHIEKNNATWKEEHPTFDVFVASGLSGLVEEASHRKQNKYEYTLVDLNQVAFHMLRDNFDRVADQLDDIRINKHKFVCLNDDMNQTHPKPEVKQLLHDFYDWYFPERSSFELPDGVVNQFLRIEQLQQHHARQSYIHVLVNASAVLLMVCVCLCMIHMRTSAKAHAVRASSAHEKV